MMKLYFVKQDLFGIPKGTVERFADYKAAQFLQDGAIEPFDPKKHGSARGAPRPEEVSKH